jgi:hypothetical protein
MKHPRLLPVVVLLIGLYALALHANSTDKATATEKSPTPYRYTAVELAEETIDAYEALETNDVALAKEILLNAIVNYIEDDERGRSAVTSETKIDQKAKRVRGRFRAIYAELMKSQK